MAWVARVPNVLVVNASSGITDLKELVARAKAKPGQLSYSSGGNGSAAHITFEYLKLRAGIFMAHIPYRGTAPSVTDLIGGQVDATFTGAPGAAAAHPQRPAARAGGVQPAAHCRAARGADGGRERLPRLRGRPVVRHRRPGRHARRPWWRG